MPLKGFLCEVTGSPVDFDKCVACAGNGSLVLPHEGCHCTPPVLRGIIASQGRRDPEVVKISVTMLLGCLRKTALEQTHDFWVKPSHLYWSWRGCIGHSIVESAHGQDQAVYERRFYRDVAGITVSGQPDVFYPAEQRLVDYKTAKAVPRDPYVCARCGTNFYANGSRKPSCPTCGRTYENGEVKALKTAPALPYGHHIEQVNGYRWVLAANGYEIDVLEVVYLDMMQVKRTFAPVWDLDCTEQFIGERASIVKAALEGGPVPPKVQGEEAWQCPDHARGKVGYCPVANICAELVVS